VNLLQGLQKRHGLTSLFTAHDLSVMHNISDQPAEAYATMDRRTHERAHAVPRSAGSVYPVHASG
jgi:ABC-type oligopeptide transport system ATPase subunit